MIRYRLPHNFPYDTYICRDCGASEEAIEDGRKSRYCRKNRNFKAPGMYISYSSLEKRMITISKNPNFGLSIAAMILDSLEPEFNGWSTPEILKSYDQAFGASWSIPPQACIPRLLSEEELQNLKPGAFVQMDGEPEPVVYTRRPISAEEHCRMFCAWKGGGPCRATDCPRDIKIANDEEHAKLLAAVEVLMKLDPPLTTLQGWRLANIARVVEEYEKKRWPL